MAKKYIFERANEAMTRALALPPTKPLYKSWWYENELHIMYATTNVGKSVLAWQIANNIAESGRTVMYLDYELSLSQYRDRYSDDKTGEAYHFSNNLIYPDLTYEQISTNKLEDSLFEMIEQSIAKEGVSVIIIDNITFISERLSSGECASALMKKLNALKLSYNVSIMLLAHTTKQNTSNKGISVSDLSGSSRLMNFCDSSIAIGKSTIDDNQLYIKQMKVRTGRIVNGSNNVQLCHIDKLNNFLQFIDDETDNEANLIRKVSERAGSDKTLIKANVMLMYKQGAKKRAIARDLNISEGTVRNWLKEYDCCDEYEQMEDIEYETVG